MKSYAWGVLSVCALIAGYFAFFRDDPGKSDFKKQLAALDTVKSWTLDIQFSRNGTLIARRRHSAVCPDMEQVTESGPDGLAEYIRTSDLVFYKKGVSWVKDSNVPVNLFLPFPTPRPCMSNPGGSASSPGSGDTEYRDELRRAIKDGTFERGGLEDVHGQSCRNYQVSWLNARGQLMAYIMCINEQDHLPRRIQDPRQTVTMYFDWNVPVEVRTPDIAPTDPKLPSQGPGLKE